MSASALGSLVVLLLAEAWILESVFLAMFLRWASESVFVAVALCV